MKYPGKVQLMMILKVTKKNKTKLNTLQTAQFLKDILRFKVWIFFE